MTQNKRTMDTGMVAPCGINCAVCYAHLTRKSGLCPGCNSEKEGKMGYCSRCKIKNCEKLKDIKSNSCVDCQDFPCQRIKNLDKRYSLRYRMSVIKNLQNIKEQGIKKFEESEKAKWSCKACQGIVCVHSGECIDCGKKRADQD